MHDPEVSRYTFVLGAGFLAVGRRAASAFWIGPLDISKVRTPTLACPTSFP